MTRLEKLIDTIARLNPDAGEIGPGMLANIVQAARAVQAERAKGADSLAHRRALSIQQGGRGHTYTTRTFDIDGSPMDCVYSVYDPYNAISCEIVKS